MVHNIFGNHSNVRKHPPKFPRAAGVVLGALMTCCISACERTQSINPTEAIAPVDSLQALRATFGNPESCKPCHPNHFQEWQTSMHAYAFSDPIFFKLNEIGQERSNDRLDQFCIKCHSPVATIFGEAPPGFDPAGVSALAKKGVQCDVCHSISSFERGRGIQAFHTDQIKRGPIPDPQANAFHESAFDLAYEKSKICAPCHDVLSPDDVQIEFTATEWDRSPYAGMGLECQGCHMPAYQGRAAVGGPSRTVHRHTFVGVDVPLVDFPGREQATALVRDLLQNAISLKVTAPSQLKRGEELPASVQIINDKTGHSVPSGAVFERQMWLEVILLDPLRGDVLFESGTLDDNGDLLNSKSEAVRAGIVPADSNLALYHGTPYRNGEETLFFWEADAIRENTIPAFSSSTAEYRMPLSMATSTVQLQIRLRFRSFPPYLLRAIGKAELLQEMPIFDMATFQQTITISD